MLQDHEHSSFDISNLSLNGSNEFTFGEYMRSLRKAKNISVRQLAKAVNKTPTYISDIENGNNKPPDKELLENIIESLSLSSLSRIKENLYDLAAFERDDIPLDIKKYIVENPIAVKMLRVLSSNPNARQIMISIVSERLDGGTHNDAK